MSFQSIKEIIDARAFDSFIGLNEDSWFEAKQRAPYDLNVSSGRYELAKDVSAFANSEGGFLVVGLQTEPDPTVNSDRVTSLDLLTEAEFHVRQFEGIINELVYPMIRALNVAWIPMNPPQVNTGLGVIEVPAQRSNYKYFLTANVVLGEARLRQIVFGLCQRNSAANDPMSIAELHSLMQSGKHPVPESLARIEEKIDLLLDAQAEPAEPIDPPDLLTRRIDRIFEEPQQ